MAILDPARGRGAREQFRNPLPRGASFLRNYETPKQKKRDELLEEARRRLREVDRQLNFQSREEELRQHPERVPGFELLSAEAERLAVPDEVPPTSEDIRAAIETEKLRTPPAFQRGITRFVDPQGAFASQVVRATSPEALLRAAFPEADIQLSATKPRPVGELVDPIAAARGSVEEQERAAQVLADLGFVGGMLFSLIDLTLLIPGVGLTKVRQFQKLLRIASGGGRGAEAAKVALASHEVVTAARELAVKEGLATTDRAVAEQALGVLVREERAAAQRGVLSITVVKGKTNTFKRILRAIRDGKPSSGSDAILRGEIEETLRFANETAAEVLEEGTLDIFRVPRIDPNVESILEAKNLLSGRVTELGGNPATIENMTDKALEAATTVRVVEPASVPVESLLDDIAQGADTPRGDPGVNMDVADDVAEFVEQTTESASDVGNKWVSWPRPITDMVPEVVTKEDRASRWLIGKTGVNPSILDNTEIGKLLQAYYRSNIAAKEQARALVPIHD